MINKRGQFFSLYLVALTLFMCAIVVWMYVIGQDNATSSLVSPVGVLSVRDELEVFEMREVELIKSSFSGVSFGEDGFEDKFRKNFLDGISEEMKGFILDGLVVGGRVIGETGGFFENVLYRESLTFVEGDKLKFSREKVGKRKLLKPSIKSKNYFPVDFVFEFERSYLISEVGGKIEVEVV